MKVSRLRQRSRAARAVFSRWVSRARHSLSGSDKPELEVILHCGQHKTGTTSLQAFMRLHRRELARRGIYVPSTGMNSGAHHRLMASLLGEPDDEALADSLATELRWVRQPTVLISSEMAKRGIVEGHGNQIVEGLRSAGATRVRLVMYLRSPFASANSAYAEVTGQLGRRGATFPQFVSMILEEGYFNYDAFLRLNKRSDVELTVLPYSASVRHDVVQDFIKALGLRLHVPTRPRLNQTVGPIALEALRQIGLEVGLLPPTTRYQLRDRLRPIAFAYPEEPFWGVDADIERQLERADAYTEEFSLAVWGVPWRKMIGDERRELNIFDPATQTPKRAIYLQLLNEMRSSAAKLLVSSTISS